MTDSALEYLMSFESLIYGQLLAFPSLSLMDKQIQRKLSRNDW